MVECHGGMMVGLCDSVMLSSLIVLLSFRVMLFACDAVSYSDAVRLHCCYLLLHMLLFIIEM
jgi:hypothetical protein